MHRGGIELNYAPEYVAARAVLLDALNALGDHLPAIILVGAQAVYLHTGPGDLVVPPMTTDGDLALDVSLLGPEPEITGALEAADFTTGKNPGSWIGRGGIAVDIMVVPSQSGRTKKAARGARLQSHGNNAARITPGLEPALVDHALHTLAGLDPNDHRQVEVNVAGPAALLIAKAIKIEDRFADAAAGTSARVREKDALDILRLLQATETAELVAGLRRHLDLEIARDATTRGLNILREHGVTPTAQLPTLAAAAAGGDPAIAPSLVALLQSLLRHLSESPPGTEADGVAPRQ
jgi:hypothetical protein